MPPCCTLVAGCAIDGRFAANELLAREGAPADRFFAIRDGRVALEVEAPAARHRDRDPRPRARCCGWSWLFAPYRWQFDVRALSSRPRPGRFDAACLRAKIDADHALGYELMRRFAAVMLERLQATRLRLIDVYGNPAG